MQGADIQSLSEASLRTAESRGGASRSAGTRGGRRRRMPAKFRYLEIEVSDATSTEAVNVGALAHQSPATRQARGLFRQLGTRSSVFKHTRGVESACRAFTVTGVSAPVSFGGVGLWACGWRDYRHGWVGCVSPRPRPGISAPFPAVQDPCGVAVPVPRRCSPPGVPPCPIIRPGAGGPPSRRPTGRH